MKVDKCLKTGYLEKFKDWMLWKTLKTVMFAMYNAFFCLHLVMDLFSSSFSTKPSHVTLPFLCFHFLVLF